MDRNKKNTSIIALKIGVLGSIAGLFLIFTKIWLAGITGTIASVAVAIKGYIDLKPRN